MSAARKRKWTENKQETEEEEIEEEDQSPVSTTPESGDEIAFKLPLAPQQTFFLDFARSVKKLDLA